MKNGAAMHSTTAAARLGSAVPGRGSCHGNPTTPESFISSLLSVRPSVRPSIRPSVRVSRTLVRALLHRAGGCGAARRGAARVVRLFPLASIHPHCVHPPPRLFASLPTILERTECGCLPETGTGCISFAVRLEISDTLPTIDTEYRHELPKHHRSSVIATVFFFHR